MLKKKKYFVPILDYEKVAPYVGPETEMKWTYEGPLCTTF